MGGSASGAAVRRGGRRGGVALDPLHQQVAGIVLRVAARHGFALAGGNALMAHGVIARPTQDVDLFTDRQRGVTRARDVVERALLKAGFDLERVDLFGGLAAVFDGVEDQMAEWIVTAPDGRQTMLQMSFFARSHGPVSMDLGPVLALEDALGSKICALLGRSEVRDYLDAAAAMRRYSVDQLLWFASRLDPAVVTVKDVVAVGRRLDRLDDDAFARYGLSRGDIATIRTRFGSWPRSLPPGGTSPGTLRFTPPLSTPRRPGARIQA